MSRVTLYTADVLIIVAGMTWAYIAGRHSVLASFDTWPRGMMSASLSSVPYVGMLAEGLFIWLASEGRLRTTIELASFSLICGIALIVAENLGVFGFRV